MTLSRNARTQQRPIDGRQTNGRTSGATGGNGVVPPPPPRHASRSDRAAGCHGLRAPLTCRGGGERRHRRITPKVFRVHRERGNVRVVYDCKTGNPFVPNTRVPFARRRYSLFPGRFVSISPRGVVQRGNKELIGLERPRLVRPSTCLRNRYGDPGNRFFPDARKNVAFASSDSGKTPRKQ